MSCTATVIFVGFFAFWFGIYVAYRVAILFFRESR